jgi:glycosyltransferase involved in cell wall biosynthesis
MKIVHIITNLSYGGAEMMLYKLLSLINRQKWQPTVICLNIEGELSERVKELNIPIHSIGMKRGKPSLSGLWSLVKLIKQIKPDLIQGWMYHGNLASQVAGFLYNYKIPVVWNIPHSLSSLEYEKKSTANIIRILAQLSRFSSKIIYNSKISAKQHEKVGFQKEKTVPFPDGFLTDIFVSSEEARLTLRQELGLKPDSLIIGRIARYHPMKDYENLLKAAAIVLKQHPLVHFVLVGPDIDENNQELSLLIQHLGIENNIHRLGIRADTHKLNAGFDIACTTSAWGEGFPNVVGEAMSCGVPCVVTDVGDSAWIVEDTGEVVPPSDTEALAQAWEKLINLTPLDRQILGEKARQRIIEHFSITKIVSKYESLYQNILDNV